METVFFERTGNIRREKKFLEGKLNVKLNIIGKKITLEGNALEEYEARIVLEAISFGFSAKVSIILKDPEVSFREIPIRDFTRKKNLESVRARLIGKHGRTKSTIEGISDCKIIIRDNAVGIIGSANEIEHTITAITNLIKGSKQSNVYNYLEKINRNKQK